MAEAKWPECDNHIEVQHRDGNPPWCRTCGWYRGGRLADPQFVRTPSRVLGVMTGQVRMDGS